MTTICVTFICNFLKHSIVRNEKSSITLRKLPKRPTKGSILGKETTSKRKSKDKSRRSANLENYVDLYRFINEPLTVTHNVNTPLKYLHIEYNILPKFIYKIDIVFWGTVAKVYTKDGVKAMKAIIKNNHISIAFSIKHKFVLDENEVLNYKSHTVTFVFCTDKDVLSTSAKQETGRTFYFQQDDIDSKEEFAEAFEYDPNSYENILLYPPKSVVESTLDDLLNFCSKNETLNLLNIIPDYEYRKKVSHILQKIDDYLDIKCLNKDEEIIVKDEIPSTSKPSRQQSRKSTEKGGKKGKANYPLEKEIKTLIVKIPCEIFFTDPNLGVFDLKNSNKNLTSAFIIIDIKNLISEEMKKKMNPITIKIDHMYNVPVTILEKNNFEYIFAKYNICDDTYTTNLRPLASQIEFQEHVMLFLPEEKFIRFCGQITTGYFVLQIMGRRSLEATKGKLFNKNMELSRFVHRKHEVLKYSSTTDFETMILIGIACFKLDLLYDNPHKFCRTEYCINPARSPVPLNSEANENLSFCTPNTIHQPTEVPANANPFKANELTINKTSVKLRMEICVPVTNILRDLKTAYNYYARIIIRECEPNLAELVISTATLHNSFLLGNDDILPNYVINKAETQIQQENDLITGFVIDSGNSFIIFLEGKTHQIHELCSLKMAKERRKSIYYLYNSDTIYEQRFYKYFLKNRRIYTITLNHPLSKLFSKPKIFAPGVMPHPCQAALRKLHYISNSIIMRDISDNLLPTVEELYSLDIEWGVPIYWPVEPVQSPLFSEVEIETLYSPRSRNLSFNEI